MLDSNRSTSPNTITLPPPIKYSPAIDNFIQSSILTQEIYIKNRFISRQAIERDSVANNLIINIVLRNKYKRYARSGYYRFNSSDKSNYPKKPKRL